MKRPGLLLAVVLALTAGCATPPPPSMTTANTAPAAMEDAREVTVYLVPLDDFDVDYSVRMARQFSGEFGVRVKSSLPMGTRELQPFSGTRQYAAEDIFARAAPVLDRLPERAPTATYVLLTNRDINSRSRLFRFMFSWHDTRLRASVISTARLRPEGDFSPRAAAVLANRLNKMIKRAIGELQFGWRRSSDIGDVMYAPIMSVADIDRMGYAHRP
jgi:predicted Zn-dependent protease